MLRHSIEFWFVFTPVILTALAVILVVLLRWFSHKERMALIRRGGQPLPDKPTKEEQAKTLLVIGLPISLIGLGGLTIGLLTLGLGGPWLLAGLLPLFAGGLALILTALVLKPPKEKKEKAEAVPWPETEAAPAEEPLPEWDQDEEKEE